MFNVSKLHLPFAIHGRDWIPLRLAKVSTGICRNLAKHQSLIETSLLGELAISANCYRRLFQTGPINRYRITLLDENGQVYHFGNICFHDAFNVRLPESAPRVELRFSIEPGPKLLSGLL